MQLQTHHRNEIVITYLGLLSPVTILLTAMFAIWFSVNFWKVVLIFLGGISGTRAEEALVLGADREPCSVRAPQLTQVQSQPVV